MAQHVYQVVGRARGLINSYRWVVATYNDVDEATQHTEFLNTFLETLRELDKQNGNDAYTRKVCSSHPFDSQHPGEDNAAYTMEPVQVLCRAGVRLAGVAAAVDKFVGN